MNIQLPLIAFLFLLLLIAAAAYLAKRLSWRFSWKRMPLLWLVLSLLAIGGFAAELLFSNATSTLASLYYVVAGVVLGFLLYLGISMLAIDLLSLSGFPGRRAGGLAALAGAALISGYALFISFRLDVKEESLSLPMLDEEIRLLHWSDLHLGHYRGTEFLGKVVSMSRELEPDLVVITGDLFDGRLRMNDRSLDPLGELSVPLYFVEGNHDVYSGREEVHSVLERAGVRVLSNEVVQHGTLQIMGLDYMLADNEAFDIHPSIEKQNLKEVLPGVSTDRARPLLLLHHAPYGIPYASDAGVDLYLAGHTHGGQLFPMTCVNQLLFRYNRGMHDYRGMKIYVSEGLGSAAIPMRLGTRSSMTLIRLLPDRE